MAAGATAALGHFSFIARAAALSAETQTAWVDRPMRWAQLTLTEDDPGQFDSKFWLDFFKRTHSDATCLSAGGVVAYYPTQIPLHHRSQWLRDSDPFGELVSGARKLGMNVIARTDSHAVHQPVFDAHPDWIAVDASGKKRRHWASPEMWVTCGLGPYNFQHMTAVHREIMERYRVDGIFINRWDGSGMCYCEHCQKNFQEAHRAELPRTSDPSDPRRRKYVLWRQQRLFELWRVWENEIRSVNPASCIIPNTGGGALSSLDMKIIGADAKMLVADRQARRGLATPWMNGKNGKEYRATLGAKPIIGCFSVGIEEPYRWKDSVQNEAEIRIWVADGIANGLRPWFTKFSGTIRDPRWLKTIEKIYRWHYRNEAYLREREPLARVGLVYSQQTAWFYGGDQAHAKVEDHTLGWYQALIEARVPFEMVHDRLLDKAASFKTLILPNIAALSDEQCDQLRAFVRNGGSLIATYETSLYNEWGERRKDFGLADLFTASFDGKKEGPMHNSYLRLETDPKTNRRHPMLSGLEEAPRIINGVWRIGLVPHEKTGSPAPLTLIPSYPDLPMEKVFPREERTNIPAVIARDLGQSRIVYFPWDIDRTFWEVLSTDHGQLLRNAITWATNEPAAVTVAGAGTLEVTMWRQRHAVTVHLVNLTNPMMMKGPYRELIPSPSQTVRVRLPKGTKPKQARWLVSDARARFEMRDGVLETKIGSVLDHEVLAVDF